MASLENLTDAELRRQLKELGETPGPITATTRAIYIKKLGKLKELENKPFDKTLASKKTARQTVVPAKAKTISAKSSTHAFGFSSDDSENEGIKLRRKQPNANLQRKRKAADVVKDVRKSTSSSVNSFPNKTTATRSRTSKITDGYSDDSDDDNVNSSKGSFVQMTSQVTNTSPGLFTWNSSSSPVTRRRSLRSYTSPANQANASSPLHSTNTDSLDDSEGDNTLGSSYTATTKYTKLSQRELKNGGDCYRRQAFQNITRQENNNKNLTKDSNEVNTNKEAFSKSLLSRFKNYLNSNKTEQHASSSEFKQTEKKAPRSWSLHCAYLLPVCTLIFFCTLGLLYVTMRTDDIAPPILQGSTKAEDQRATMKYINAVYEFLATKAGNNICQATGESNLVSLSKIKNSQFHLDQASLMKALQLIREHPEWNIFLYKTQEPPALLQSSDSVTEVHFLETTSPILPTLCRFQRAIQKVLFRIFVVAAICLSVWVMVVYRQYRLKKFEEERQTMFTLISKILDVLRKHHESSLDDDNIEPYLPIVHVRDLIVQPADRRKMSKVWDMAVHFISASESRVRVETQRVSGEDYAVWRWIQVTSPGKRQQTPGRVWQGEAFDPNQSINTPNISPTPCLKIRNMFDPEIEKGEDWHLQVQDSILEKCSGNDEIFSIKVEKNSKEGLVYVKCGSCAGAGRAFRSLHGAWFDGRLVTVKFIKLHRFHTRYPDSVNQNTPFKRSSLKPVSTFVTPDESISSGFLTSTPLKST